MTLNDLTVIAQIVDKITGAFVFSVLIFNVTAFIAFIIFMAMR